MRAAPTCPRCGRPVHAPNAWSSAWSCDVHGEIQPVQAVRGPSADALEVVLQTAQVPVWLPWPLPHNWLVTGFAVAGDERTGGLACAVALSGPNPIGNGPADMLVISEEPGIGLGARFAGLPGPDPGAGFGAGPANVYVHYRGHEFPLWNVDAPDRAVFVGEAMARWLWIVLWPETSGVLLVEPLTLSDLRDPDQDFVLPFGALSPRLDEPLA